MGRHQFDLFVPPYRFFYFRLVRRLDILPIEAIREQTLGSFSGGGGGSEEGTETTLGTCSPLDTRICGGA